MDPTNAHVQGKGKGVSCPIPHKSPLEPAIDSTVLETTLVLARASTRLTILTISIRRMNGHHNTVAVTSQTVLVA